MEKRDPVGQFFENKLENPRAHEVLHEERIVEEPESVQTTKHVSLILDQLYPFPFVQTFPRCPFCNNRSLLNIRETNAYVGYALQTTCGTCSRIFNFQLMPLLWKSSCFLRGNGRYLTLKSFVECTREYYLAFKCRLQLCAQKI